MTILFKLVCVAYLFAVNLITLLLFWVDKRRSKYGRQRLSERALLLAAFSGGSIGALFGLWILRHKTRKRHFRRRLNAILALHISLAVTFAYLVLAPYLAI
ncbi:MAG: DUF1294 domain-containing protein [Rhizobiaceae bacterium]